MSLKIITDHKWKPFLYGYELTEKEKEDFDYMDTETLESSNFFRYKKSIYCTDCFMRIENHDNSLFSSYHGHHGESYFSGILIKLSNCGESYQVARYYS